MRRRIVTALLVAGLGTVAASQARPEPRSLVVRDVTLIDGTGRPAQPHVSIVVRGGRVTRIVSGTSEDEPAEIAINGTGLVAIPGLFDAHVHLSPAPWSQRADQLNRMLVGGVTSVFDLAGDGREVGDFARATLAGEIDGPSISYCALMAGPAFFTDPRVVASSLGFAAGQAPWNLSVTSDTDIVRAVAGAKGTGATAIKLYAALDASEARRIIQEAARQGLRTVAHATVFPAKPGDLVDAGVTMLAHAAYLVWEGSPPSADFTKRSVGDFAHVRPDGPEIDRVLGMMRDRGVALNPTLWVFNEARDEAAGARKAWMNAVTRRAADAGVRLVAGTDGLLDARDSSPILHRELEALVSGAGLTPMQALLSATRDAARTIGVDAERGTIEPGRAADLVLLGANPLDDIANTRKVRFVVKDGRIVSRRTASR